MTTDAVGGVWQYSTDLCSGLARHGFETMLIVLGPSPSPDQRASARAIPGVTLVEADLPLDWLSDRAGARAAGREVAGMARLNWVELIHLNSPALAAGQHFHAPVLGVAHGCVATWWEAAKPGVPLDADLLWHREAMYEGLRACQSLVAPSASYAEALRGHYRLPAAPAVVHNGRETSAPGALAPPIDCAFTAGRLWDEAKNPQLLDAVAALLPFPFLAAGALEAPHGGGIPVEHLRPLGQLDEATLAQWLSARPVFVSAARFEPFGLAVLEAAASGCALVLSDIPTFRELWEGVALFVPGDDAAAFARAVECCIAEPELRERLGRAARGRAAAYSVERMARAMAVHYRDLLASRRAA